MVKKNFIFAIFLVLLEFMTEFTFQRGERLKSRKLISRMFGAGQSFGQYPLRLVWIPQEAPGLSFPVQVAFSVPKKKFKSAVRRNRIRRKMREAWRLNKHRLYQALQSQKAPSYAFMIIYIADEALSYKEIEQATRQMIRRFLKKRTDQ